MYPWNTIFFFIIHWNFFKNITNTPRWTRKIKKKKNLEHKFFPSRNLTWLLWIYPLDFKNLSFLQWISVRTPGTVYVLGLFRSLTPSRQRRSGDIHFILLKHSACDGSNKNGFKNIYLYNIHNRSVHINNHLSCRHYKLILIL